MCTINGLQLMKYITFYNTPICKYTCTYIYSSFWCMHLHFHMHALANTRTIHTSSYSELLVHGWMLGKILVHTHTHTHTHTTAAIVQQLASLFIYRRTVQPTN